MFENIFLSTVYVLLKHKKYDQDRCSTVSRSYFFEDENENAEMKIKGENRKTVTGRDARRGRNNLSPRDLERLFDSN